MKIGVTGCAGRMGKMLLNRILVNKDCELAGGSERRESGFIGRDIGEIIGMRPLNLTVTAYPFELFEVSDAVIDFTAPAATVEHAKIAAETGNANANARIKAVCLISESPRYFISLIIILLSRFSFPVGNHICRSPQRGRPYRTKTERALCKCLTFF